MLRILGLLSGLIMLATLSYGQCDSLPSLFYTQTRPDGESGWTDQLKTEFEYNDRWLLINEKVSIWYESSWHLIRQITREFDPSGRVTGLHAREWDYNNNDALTKEHIAIYTWGGGQITQSVEQIYSSADETTTYQTTTGRPEDGEVRVEKRIEFPEYTYQSLTIHTYDEQLHEVHYFHEANLKDGTILRTTLNRYYNESGCMEAISERNFENGRLTEADSLHRITNEYCDILFASEYEWSMGRWELNREQEFRFTREYNLLGKLIHFLEEELRNGVWLLEAEEVYQYDENGYLTYSYLYGKVREHRKFITYSENYRTEETVAEVRHPLNENIWVTEYTTLEQHDEQQRLIRSTRHGYNEDLEELILVKDDYWHYSSDGLLLSSDVYVGSAMTGDFTQGHYEYYFGCDNRQEGYLYTVLDASEPEIIGSQSRKLIEYADLVTALERDRPVFRLYPVPADEYLIIEPLGTDRLEITVTDVTGRRLDRKVMSSGDFRLLLDTSFYTPGLYIIQLNTGRKQYAQRILIRH